MTEEASPQDVGTQAKKDFSFCNIFDRKSARTIVPMLGFATGAFLAFPLAVKIDKKQKKLKTNFVPTLVVLGAAFAGLITLNVARKYAVGKFCGASSYAARNTQGCNPVTGQGCSTSTQGPPVPSPIGNPTPPPAGQCTAKDPLGRQTAGRGHQWMNMGWNPRAQQYGWRCRACGKSTTTSPTFYYGAEYKCWKCGKVWKGGWAAKAKRDAHLAAHLIW